ncbi:hypothetical protein [Bradyrhizobium sp. CCBAU 11361]|uniref:hypothetical protein n=1 Tax=Bradyrhizobium sp. CCBAU 11361 TaxID=1630812 RepID=UPI00230548DA|nr:hypothetical protein [Bradyrhizobium sp. CCBAU 11361]MDA9492020.1 hypothetical protein [Bradyrhizobium sp. CCBAU 11361]
MPTAEYYLKQAEIASRMALAESDPEKARAMHILALEYYDKAYLAQVQEALPAQPSKSPDIIQRQ